MTEGPTTNRGAGQMQEYDSGCNGDIVKENNEYFLPSPYSSFHAEGEEGESSDVEQLIHEL